MRIQTLYTTINQTSQTYCNLHVKDVDEYYFHRLGADKYDLVKIEVLHGLIRPIQIVKRGEYIILSDKEIISLSINLKGKKSSSRKYRLTSNLPKYLRIEIVKMKLLSDTQQEVT